MRSAKEVIERVCSIRPSAFESFFDESIASLDLRIRRDILGESAPVYNSSALALDAPDDEVYELYLFALTDFLNGEFGRYENTSAVFEAFMEKLAARYAASDNRDSDNTSDTDDANMDKSDEKEARLRIW